MKSWRNNIAANFDLLQKKINKSMGKKVIEDTLLKEADALIEKAESQGEKVIYDLFKSAVLEKYKDAYNVEIVHGQVSKETLDKCIDSIFADTCVTYRLRPDIDDATKDDEIGRLRNSLGSFKVVIAQMLEDRGLKVI